MESYILAISVKSFNKIGCTEPFLVTATQEIEGGLVGVSIGSGLYKKRIARRGRGKSAGFRTIYCIPFTEGQIVFIYAFAKSKDENLPDKDFKSLCKFADDLRTSLISDLVERGVLLRVI